MLLTEYDYDTDIAVQRQEAYEDGVEKGISQGAQQKAIETAKNMISASLGTLEQIAQITNLPLQTIKELANK